MSFSTLGTTDSAGSTANNDENGGFTPQPVTSRYMSLREHQGVLKDAIGAHPSISMSDTDLPPVKWANAVKGALYEDDGCLGEQQAETPYTTSDFEEQHGDSIATPHDDLTKDERTELRELFRKSENHNATDLDGQFKLPVVNGDRLPLLVADEDVLREAIDMLDAIVNENHNHASGTPSEVDDEKNDAEFPVLEGTLNDLDTFLADSTPDEETLEAMLEAEKDGKDRKGGKDRLEAAIEERSTTGDDEETRSTTSGLSDEQIEKVATATATAVASTLSEMDF